MVDGGEEFCPGLSLERYGGYALRVKRISVVGYISI